MTTAIWRIALVGPMGIGKTTALQALCGGLRSTSDGLSLDGATHAKAFASVGTEFGEIDLGGGEKLQLCGCPGQQRFDFVRRWVLSVSVGVFIMVDVNAPGAIDAARALLAEATAQSVTSIALVLSARPATPAQREAFGAALAAGSGAVIPILQADPRSREQLLDALGVLASLLSLQQETVLPAPNGWPWTAASGKTPSRRW